MLVDQNKLSPNRCHYPLITYLTLNSLYYSLNSRGYQNSSFFEDMQPQLGVYQTELKHPVSSFFHNFSIDKEVSQIQSVQLIIVKNKREESYLPNKFGIKLFIFQVRLQSRDDIWMNILFVIINKTFQESINFSHH